MSYIQTIVDNENGKGMFILTGSHQSDIRHAVHQSLAGRTAVFELLPFSINELRKYGKGWRLPIGKKVRIKIFDIDGEFEGKLKLAESPKEINHHYSLYLKVGDTPIESSDIEQCHVLH